MARTPTTSTTRRTPATRVVATPAAELAVGRIPAVMALPEPDRMPLNEVAAARLAKLSGVAAAELAKRPVAELAEKLRFRLDPALLAFRRVCGRVVKRGPNGEMLPVPFATVHVEDTDSTLLGWFPAGFPYGWYFPVSGRREVIAVAKTDACGRFCAWVPRFDIDWVLRWRAQRVCYDVIFERPTLADLLDDIEGIRPPERIRWPDLPIPEPDPLPILRDGGFAFRRVEQLVGRDTAEALARAERASVAGAPVSAVKAMLASTPVRAAPPMAKAWGDQHVAGAAPKTMAAMLPQGLRLSPDLLKQMRPDRWIGPFRRCRTVLMPEWVPITDVPDITFRVTQDVDNDGAEETIYAEGFFDVRWNAGPIPDVTLEASSIAVAGVSCDVPDIACGTIPAVTFAGLMPLLEPASPASPYHDAVTGYAKRPNRPRPSGLDPVRPSDPVPLPPADTPYCGTLQLYGCVEFPNVAHYRLRYRHNGGPQVSFTGLTWPLHRVVGGALQTVWQAADGDGWYPVRPVAEGWHPARLLLNWPTRGFADGLYEVTLETANAAKAVLQAAAPVSFRVDNSRPSAQFTSLRWRTLGGAWSAPMELVCPVIRRPAGQDIEIEVGWLASSAHLRSAFLRGGGCGGSAAPVLVSAEDTAERWHTTPLDNAVARTAVFRLAGTELRGTPPVLTAVQGAFSFSLDVASRAFNPSGGDGGFEADWVYDPVAIHIVPSLPVAVVNA